MTIPGTLSISPTLRLLKKFRLRRISPPSESKIFANGARKSVMLCPFLFKVGNYWKISRSVLRKQNRYRDVLFTFTLHTFEFGVKVRHLYVDFPPSLVPKMRCCKFCLFSHFFKKEGAARPKPRALKKLIRPCK